MTDLPTILPGYPTKPYTHLLPSLDRHGITVADLLSLDALEIAKRASLPILDLRRLAQDVIHALQDDLDIRTAGRNSSDELLSSSHRDASGKCRRPAVDIVERWNTISLLDARLDEAIGSGIPAGYVTEVTGERQVDMSSSAPTSLMESSAAGKTQFLLTLLLSTQLPAPRGLSRSSIYISTEAPLSTPRLSQILDCHPHLSQLPAGEKPSLTHVYAIPVQDLESQDHILAFQLPHAIRQYNVGLVVLDSVAANYRAEHGSTAPRDLANRAAQLAKLGRLLRDLARENNIAVVVANQVSDRFEEVNVHIGQSNVRSSSPLMSSSPALPNTQGAPPSSAGISNANASTQESPLTLDFQQRFFTGWGDELPGSSPEGLKTPALGLGWSNQIACRIALKMEVGKAGTHTRDGTVAGYQGGNLWIDRKKRRFWRLVFAPWTPTTLAPIEFEIKAGGIAACSPDEGHT